VFKLIDHLMEVHFIAGADHVAMGPALCRRYTSYFIFALIIFVKNKTPMITTSQKTLLKEALTKSFDEFIAAFALFNDNEVNQIPFAGSWTPAQVASHIILATDGVPDGTTSASDRPFDAFLPMIRPWWEDLSQKFTSPEPLRPDDKPGSRSEVLNELNRVRGKDLTIIDDEDLTAVCKDFELPTIGYLTRYEWLWFIQMHLNRHTFQLKNIRKKM
jgi:hypothetical protein